MNIQNPKSLLLFNPQKIILIFILTILLLLQLPIPTQGSNNCQDDTGNIDVGFTYRMTCDEIMNQRPDFCNKRNNVKNGCQQSCGTCNYDPFEDCHNTQGKFTVGHSLINCNAYSSRPYLCNWHAFQENCPVTCDLCSTPSTSVTASNECTGKAPDCCGGLTNTCNLRINEIMFAAMHNANNDEGHWNSNHDAPLEDALESGFRAFYLDVCYCHNTIVFCHGNCYWAGEQDPTEVFEHIVQFLDDNPSELIIFNFEMAHGDPTPLQLWNVMKQVDGLKSKSYVHDGGYWPTLGYLLQNGKQIISLKHNGNNCVNTANSGCTPYIQEFFKYTIGTNYAFDSIEDIEDISQSCKGMRGTYYKQQFYAINNFVTNNFPGPSEDAAKILNNETFVAKRISDCEMITSRKANFLAVDFWQHGDVPKVAKQINDQRGNEKMGNVGSASSDASKQGMKITVLILLGLMTSLFL